jgi:hypothetical protein
MEAAPEAETLSTLNGMFKVRIALVVETTLAYMACLTESDRGLSPEAGAQGGNLYPAETCSHQRSI